MLTYLGKPDENLIELGIYALSSLQTWIYGVFLDPVPNHKSA